MYRPITLAPTVGKVLEKIISDQIQRVFDNNFDNHAYRRGKSCQSAIIEVSEWFRKQRQMSKQFKNYRLVPIILCEDIASAFESIDSECLVDILDLIFEDGDFKLSKMVKSYMLRKSFTVEKDDFIQLCKKEVERSAPQGSILSPKFWRLFDCLFSRLYTNGLEDFAATCDFLRSIGHTSYADDHKTYAILKFSPEASDDEIREKISFFALNCRQLLNTSTRDVGCGINLAKSEVILPPSWQVEGIKSKSCYTWLGYSLKLSDSMHLCFTDDRANERFMGARRTINDIYQHVCSIFARWKIYKVFVAPIVDWFNLAMFHKPMKDFSASNDCAVFQQDILCEAVNVTRTVKRDSLEELLLEKPVFLKMQILANNLSRHLNRTIDSIKTPQEVLDNPQETRRGHVDPARWLKADAKDLGDRILIYKQIFKETPESDINHFFGKFNFETHVIKHFTDSVNRCIHNRIERDRPENEIIIAKNKNLRKKRELCRELGKKNKKS